MKKYVLIIICLSFLSCYNKIDDLFEKNREDFISLAQLFQQNRHIFKNDLSTNSVFYAYVFDKSYEELPETSDWNNIGKELYSKLKVLFNKLKIYEFYISPNGNFYFKLEERDFFVKANDYYLGFSEENNVEDDMTSFDGCKIREYRKIENNWYSVMCSSSPAN